MPRRPHSVPVYPEGVEFFENVNYYSTSTSCTKVEKKEKIEQKADVSLVFMKKIAKANTLLSQIKTQKNIIKSFLFELHKKPQEIEVNEFLLQKLLQKLPKFTLSEQKLYLQEEYDLIKKYRWCLVCNKEISFPNQETQETRRIQCLNCGMTYWANKEKSMTSVIPETVAPNTIRQI
jgi:DNA-directed RNA polymerase subunit RPC12/RpoP